MMPKPLLGERCRIRHGITTAEVLVSIALLTLGILLVGKFSGVMGTSLRDQEFRALVNWELQNVRERVQSWDFQYVSVENIEQLPVSESLRQRVEGARWVARLKMIAEPISAKQVDLHLVGEVRGQRVEPVQHMFWVPGDAEDLP